MIMSSGEIAIDSNVTSVTAPTAMTVASAVGAATAPTEAAGRGALSWQPVVKRVFDLAVAVLAMVVLAPLFLVIALAIKLTDPGPVFYRHRRITFGGQPLEIIKFRTMHARYSTGTKFGERTDADVFAELGCPEMAQAFLKGHKLREDPRISRIGAWLRRTSLDELPQLWNILRGDLSTVGPRPVVNAELERYGEAANLVLSSSKPGLTGLWQVSGRCDLEYDERVALDLQYVQSWTLLQDLKILARTVPAVLSRRGAY